MLLVDEVECVCMYVCVWGGVGKRCMKTPYFLFHFSVNLKLLLKNSLLKTYIKI